MATPDQSEPVGAVDGRGLVVAVIHTRWNPEIVDRLVDGSRRALADIGVDQIESVEVAGAFELPFAARVIAGSGRVDAIVALGAVVRGETTHYQLVSEECARGLQDVQIATGVPIGFGVLATETVEQALARSGDAGGHNVGDDAARVAVEMALLARRWAPSDG